MLCYIDISVRQPKLTRYAILEAKILVIVYLWRSTWYNIDDMATVKLLFYRLCSVCLVHANSGHLEHKPMSTIVTLW